MADHLACWNGSQCAARVVAVASIVLVAGCASTTPAGEATAAAAPEPVPEIRPGILAGYLGKDLPDSLLLLPAPPAAESAAFMHDQAVSRASQMLRNTPRGALASADA